MQRGSRTECSVTEKIVSLRSLRSRRFLRDVQRGSLDIAMKMTVAITLVLLAASAADAHVVRLRIERREVVLNGRAFGAAGPYEKLVGKVDFGVDPNLPRNQTIVDLKLAPRNAAGEVEASADFYMLTPVDPARGN